MLLQTNSYVVPKDKRLEHAKLMRRFRQTLLRLGCDHFEVYEQTGGKWEPMKNEVRFIQMMRFRDKKHHQQMQDAERVDQGAQQLIREFCDMIGFQDQQATGLFAVGYYKNVISTIAEELAEGGEAAVDATQPT
jgi:hypothetical protein